MSSPRSLFPPLECAYRAHLQLSADHRIYVEACGASHGCPVLFLHGGPGSSINPNHRRFFDPDFYRIVLFDQRGCGQSTPAGWTACNTTQDLIDDIERLRHELQIGSWVLFGGSWGSTLALAYAQQHPQRVRAMVLRGVFLASREEVAWYLEGLRAFVPEAWSRLSGGDDEVSPAALLARYHALVTSADERIAQAAAERWSAYESAVMAIGETPVPPGGATGGGTAGTLARVRIQLHYLVNDCFLAADTLLGGTPRLREIPAIIVQGRRDLVCPPATAHMLHRRWPGSQLRMVEEAGHSAMHPAMVDALVRATEDVKALIEGGSA